MFHNNLKKIIVCFSVTVILLVLWRSGICESRPSGQIEGIFDVKLDQIAKRKIIAVRVMRYVGFIGPHGWVGWTSKVYTINMPLGAEKNDIDVKVTGPDVDSESTYGYVTLDHKRSEISIHIRQLNYSNESAETALNNGNSREINIRSLKVIGDEPIPINGTYRVDNQDAFR